MNTTTIATEILNNIKLHGTQLTTFEQEHMTTLLTVAKASFSKDNKEFLQTFKKHVEEIVLEMSQGEFTSAYSWEKKSDLAGIPTFTKALTLMVYCIRNEKVKAGTKKLDAKKLRKEYRKAKAEAKNKTDKKPAERSAKDDGLKWEKLRGFEQIMLKIEQAYGREKADFYLEQCERVILTNLKAEKKKAS